MATPEQFAGCLIGKCVGDAIGCPIEGQTPEQCREYIDRCIRPGVIESWSGQYSDDSQFARELVQSIVSCGTFDPVHYARHVCALFAENRIVGPGMGATAAALRLVEGVPWDQAGTPAPSAGNGTAMRVAAWCREDDPDLAEVIGQISEWRNEKSDTVREIGPRVSNDQPAPSTP